MLKLLISIVEGVLKPPAYIPKWFLWLNRVILCPIILWPLIFFGTIFIFDNPPSLLLAWGLFIGINSYPLIVAAIVTLNYKLFSVYRPAAIALTIIVLAAYGVGFWYIGSSLG